MMKNAQDRIIYIGKAKSLRSRVTSYFNTSQSASLKNKFLVQQIKDLDYIVTKNEVEAFLLEASLIKKHNPRYNVRLRDDAQYPYIRCSVKDKFPRIYIERRVKDLDSLYFGPYTHGSFVRNLQDFLNKNFQLRDCSDSDFKTRKRPCLTHDMGFCKAPCVQKQDSQSYKKQFQKTLKFLKGNHKPLVATLKKDMDQLSKDLRYEEAGRARDYLKAIAMIDQSQSVIQESSKDQDIVVTQGNDQGFLIEFLFLRQGRLINHRYIFLENTNLDAESLLSYLNQYYQDHIIPDEILMSTNLTTSQMRLLKQALSQRKRKTCRVRSSESEQDQELIQMAFKNAKIHFQEEIKKEKDKSSILLEIQKKFHLNKWPFRIECYDISHWQGQETVGSQVVFENGIPCKKAYRLYKLKGAVQKDDYKSLKEVLTRRFNHKEYSDPDLVLIDGGKGQLRAAQAVLTQLKKTNIALASLAKDRVKITSKYEKKVTSSGERFYIPHRKNPVILVSQSKSLHCLLHLRDEAHRFAVEFHRKRRDKNFLSGDLDEIKGLGVKRKQKLLTHFKSLKKLKQASLKEISSVPSISQDLAKKIKLYFSNNTE